MEFSIGLTNIMQNGVDGCDTCDLHHRQKPEAASELAGDQFDRRDAPFGDIVDHVLHLLWRILAHQNMKA